MNWIKVEDKLPNHERAVLCKTRHQPIVNYIVAFHEDGYGFVDYDEYVYDATHWCEITEPKED